MSLSLNGVTWIQKGALCTVARVLASALRQEEQIKGVQVERKSQICFESQITTLLM
jgi:hypothetical protein